MSTTEIILSIIFNHALEEFIGMAESDEFESRKVTGIRTILNSKEDIYELAKDVSSLANENGGFLIIGLRTAQLETDKIDRVSTLDLFPERRI